MSLVVDAIALIEDYYRHRLGLHEIRTYRDYTRDAEIIDIRFGLRNHTPLAVDRQAHEELRVVYELLRRGTASVTYISRGPMISFSVEASYAAIHDVKYRTFVAPWQKLAQTSQPSDLLNIEAPAKKLVEDAGISDEVIVAYRDFEIGATAWDNVWIKSRNEATWPEYAPMIASCGKDILKSKHDAPQETCECGIYAFSDPKHSDLKQTAIAWGEVYLWGDVFICESGYRAEYAYPKTIFLRDNGTKLRKRIAHSLEEAYGVPVYVAGDKGQTVADLFEDFLKASEQ